MLTRNSSANVLRPAIKLCASLSRLSARFGNAQERADREAVVSIFSRLEREREIMLLSDRADPLLTNALEHESKLHALINQPLGVLKSISDGQKQLRELASKINPHPQAQSLTR
jgi:flagellar biosynthesis/type III secretory pathway ATPase